MAGNLGCFSVLIHLGLDIHNGLLDFFIIIIEGNTAFTDNLFIKRSHLKHFKPNPGVNTAGVKTVEYFSCLKEIFPAPHYFLIHRLRIVNKTHNLSAVIAEVQHWGVYPKIARQLRTFPLIQAIDHLFCSIPGDSNQILLPIFSRNLIGVVRHSPQAADVLPFTVSKNKFHQIMQFRNINRFNFSYQFCHVKVSFSN